MVSCSVIAFILLLKRRKSLAPFKLCSRGAYLTASSPRLLDVEDGSAIVAPMDWFVFGTGSADPAPLKKVILFLKISAVLLLSPPFLKSMNTTTAFKLWLFTPSINCVAANMCVVVDCPGRNPFWLGHRCLLTFDLILFKAICLRNLQQCKRDISPCSSPFFLGHQLSALI